MKELVKEREFTFNNNPAAFSKLAEWFADQRSRLRVQQGRGDWWGNYHYNERTNSGYVSFRPADESIDGWVEAISIPEGRSLIQVFARSGEWPKLRETWGLLETELRRQGWIIDQDKQPAADPEQCKRTRRRGANAETPGKLTRLREIRTAYKKNGEVQIAFGKACELAGIWPDTVKKNDLELVENWSNYEY